MERLCPLLATFDDIAERIIPADRAAFSGDSNQRMKHGRLWS